MSIQATEPLDATCDPRLAECIDILLRMYEHKSAEWRAELRRRLEEAGTIE